MMSDNHGDLQGLNVLFVAYFYPPTDSTGVPGCMRTLKFVRNLSNGSCHVLTTTPSVSPLKDSLGHISLPANGEHIHRASTVDIFRFLLSLRKRIRTLLAGRQQAASVPVQSVLKTDGDESENKRSRLQRIKDFVYDICYFPDQAGPWLIPAFVRGIRIVRKHRIDAIFATGSPWSGLVVGYLISRFTGKPLIVDFRDPWMDNPFHLSKGRLLDSWSARLERRVVHHASAVSLNTDPLKAEFLQRYPDIEPDKFFVMPNGYDPEDFRDIQPESRKESSNTLVLCHAGFLYGVRDPAVLLEAIRDANQQLRNQGKRIIFRQIGDVNLGYDVRERYSDLVSDGSLILDKARPYRECLSALTSADIVVNVQPGTKTQIPSKLYDYLAINKPILNITSTEGALGDLVLRKGLGDLVSFDQQEELTHLLMNYSASGLPGQFQGYENRADFSVTHIAKELAERIRACTQSATP